jgi:hypothetical protein
MKSILTIMLAITSYTAALAQNKNNLYVDVGINELGIAATYDRKLTRHFDIGVGINAHRFSSAHLAQNRAACYLDLRPYWVKKKSMLFVFVDVGAAYKGGQKYDSSKVTPVGFYSSLGAGYHYRINSRGMGPYVSAGFYSYAVNVRSINANLPQRAREYTIMEAILKISLGFKF